MHTFSETGAGVPAFLAKLWRLVEDPETNHLIYWNKDGRSFIIQNQAQFARELLPLNYKHNNMASFIRQLNMYGFHKITSIDNGGLKFDRDEMEFSHPCFKRGHPYLLEHIKRKIATAKTTIDEKGLMKPEAVNKVLNEVKVMRGRQDSLDSRFSVMKQENEALWREIASLRQKHLKQQQIVNKLIQFLVTIVQPSRSNMSGVKRHYQLMINDAPQSSKMRKKSESDTGPVIHELTEELLDEVADSDAELLISSPDVLSPSHDPMGSDEQNPDDTLNPNRPRSNLSTSSNTQYDTNQNDDIIPSTSKNNSKYIIDGGGNKRQINADGVVYHISEISENNQDNIDDNTSHYIEENVLSTPLVKKQLEIAQHQQQQQLKKLKRLKYKKQQQQQQQRLMQASTSSGIQKKTNVGGNVTSSFRTGLNQQQQQQQRQQQTQKTTNTNNNASQMKIKTEKDLDSLLFLDYSNDVPTSSSSSDQSIDPVLISPLSGEIQNVNQQIRGIDIGDGGDNSIFTTSDIMTSDMPSDLFEDSSMIDDIELTSESYNPNENLKLGGGGNSNMNIANKTNTFLRGKSLLNDNEDNTNGRGKISTTVTQATAGPSSTMSSSSPTAAVHQISNENSIKSEKNMTLAKYNSPRISDDDIMRDDFNGHLDGVQEDLENLRDILRNDGYTLDANTILGNSTPANRFILSSPLDGDLLAKLFSDSDVLAPYGLQIANENSQDCGAEKKGSELMTYQPSYYADLSDILDVSSDGIPKTPGKDIDKSPRTLTSQSSVLNTPYHE